MGRTRVGMAFLREFIRYLLSTAVSILTLSFFRVSVCAFADKTHVTDNASISNPGFVFNIVNKLKQKSPFLTTINKNVASGFSLANDFWAKILGFPDIKMNVVLRLINLIRGQDHSYCLRA